MRPFLTIAEASALIAARKLSPVELARMCLDRIRQLDPSLHSFLRLTEVFHLEDQLGRTVDEEEVR